MPTTRHRASTRVIAPHRGSPARRRRVATVLAAIVLVAGLAACEPLTPYSWGANASGQLGLGTTTGASTPTTVGGERWKELEAGVDVTCGTKADRTLWCWGANGAGQLGDGTTTTRTAPVQVAPGQEWKAVAPGWDHTCAVRGDGSLWCWGANAVGQLGDGTTTPRTSPVRVGTASDWTAVDVGRVHTCGLRAGGELWCWGGNSLGQLGRGTTTPSGPPARVGTATWASLSTSRDHTCGIGLDTGLTLRCWGANTAGQLGDGTQIGRSSPVAVGGGSTWAAVGAGNRSTCAIRSDRTLWCWGENTAGQVGDGTLTGRTAPVQAGTGADWSRVSAGGQHACGIRVDRTLWCWGANDQGQLGDPAIVGVPSRTPSRIGTQTGWNGISAGSSHTVGRRDVQAPPEPTSLGIVVNGDLESWRVDDPSLPVAWHQVRWGTNTATFSYPTGDAHSGQRSVRIDVSAFTDGGLAWAFDPQPVQPSTTYVVDGWYRSDRTTELLAVFTTSGGGTVFQFLANPAPSPTSWARYSPNFTTPANATSVTLYQTITSTGFLQLDDVRVEQYVQPPLTYLGLVPNGDLEVPDLVGEPVAWDRIRWDDNDATFTHPTTDAHSGIRTARVEVTRYVDGGATWSFEPQVAAPAQTYLFSTWYRSNQPAEMLVVMTLADGSTAYQWLGIAPPSAQWTEFVAAFTTPADVADVRVFQSLTSVGWIESDDVSVVPHVPQPFNRPLVTLTFDDGYAAHRTIALPKLQSVGLAGTFYLTTSDLNTSGYLSNAQVGNLVAAGMEIGSHTVTHPHLTTLTPAQQDTELADSQTALQALTGQPIDGFCIPFGDYDNALLARIMTRYSTSRTVDDGYNYRETLDFSRIRARQIVQTTTAAEVQGWVQQAQAEGLWLVLVFHDIATTPPSFYDMTPQVFSQVIDVVKASGVAVATMGAARAELAAQVP